MYDANPLSFHCPQHRHGDLSDWCVMPGDGEGQVLCMVSTTECEVMIKDGNKGTGIHRAFSFARTHCTIGG